MVIGTEDFGDIKLSPELKGLINFWIAFNKHEKMWNEKLKAELQFWNTEYN